MAILKMKRDVALAMLLFHFETESGEIRKWYINPMNLVDITVNNEGEVFVVTTTTGDEGIKVLETEGDLFPCNLNCNYTDDIIDGTTLE